jgi:hypothetical protein
MIVKLAQDMVDNRLWVRQEMMQTWCKELKDRDLIVDFGELQAIQAKMKSYREATYKQTWHRNNKRSTVPKDVKEIQAEGE